MTIKYDLPDIGYKYKGVASKNSYTTKLGPWTITDIPIDIEEREAIDFVKRFVSNICAVEIPTSLFCNLRCKYCYIGDPRFKNKQVKPENITHILDSMSSMFPGFSKDINIRKTVNKDGVVYFSPWGAEPFANIQTLEAMYNFAHEFYPGSYKMSTSTNGTMWSDRISIFFGNLIDDKAFSSIQVSLDGPQDLHDSQRPDFKREGSFDRVKEFCQNLSIVAKEKGLKQRPYSFCSTIHLVEDDFSKNWVDAAKFFSEPNTWHTNIPSIPSRMSGEDLSDPKDVDKFINAQKLMYELVLERAKEGITVLDFYTLKLFTTGATTKSRNAFPYCSALNTQIGVDLDGSLYPCHSPITNPNYKPFLWYGNLFDKTISYKQLVRNFSYQYGTLWTKGKCKTCPIYNLADGNICWSCPGHNLAISGEPSIDSSFKCIAFIESFKYWIAIAKLTIDNPRIQSLSSEFDIPDTPNKKMKVEYKNMHFDIKYEGLTTKALDKWFGQDIKHESIQLQDSWWLFDHFQEAL